MLVNYLKIAFRNLWRNRLYTLLNVGGLALGMAAFLLIMQYVWFERSYDQQSPHASSIWRIYTENYANGALETRDANSHSAIGPTLRAELPEVIDYTRIYSARDLAAFRGTTPYLQPGAYAVDAGFFRMFPYPVLSGSLQHALDRPNTVVLTASTARRYFGTQNPVGKTLRLAGGWFTGLHLVTAVVADSPPNTHFRFSMLLAYKTLYSQGHTDNWDNYWDYNYVQLRPDANPARVQAKLTQLGNRHLDKNSLRLRMQPLTEIHLHSNLTYEHEPNGSARIVSFLFVIGLLILVLAWVNYSNLTTARSISRAKEVGLRKTIGAGRWQLIGQFIGETLLVNVLALAFAFILMQFSAPWFDSLTGRPLSQGGFTRSLAFYGLEAALLLGSVLGAGLYPSLVLSGYSPAGMLRQGFGKAIGGVGLRRILVVGQFVGTVVMLVAIITVYRQLRFLQHHDLGLSINQMLVVKAPLHDFNQDSLYQTRFDVFKAGATQLPGVERLTTSSVVPGDGMNTIGGTSNGVYWKKRVTTERQTFYFVNVDEHFFDTYGIHQLAGPGFRANESGWRSRYVINRSALKALGFPSPEAAVNELLVFGGAEGPRAVDSRVVGVIDDFHIESLKLPTRPTLYMCAPANRMSYYSFRLNGQHIPGTVAQIGQLWSKLYPESPFDYFFLDQKFNEQYRPERQFSQLFSLFTGLAVLIACLGLFGLVTFTAEQRTKEIGIRKVLGASVASLVVLLSKDFLKLVLIAVGVASPVAWYLMKRWLQDFAYRIDLAWWVFALAGLGALGIALLTVSFQSIKAAFANPVTSLRSE